MELSMELIHAVYGNESEQDISTEPLHGLGLLKLAKLQEKLMHLGP